jgi:hypothetical protein
MTGIGVRDPRRNALIGVAITLASWACVAWGAFELQTAEPDALGPALKVGLGLLPAILAPFIVLNFWWGMRVFAALRRGVGVMARWHVPADELSAFADAEPARSAPGIECLNAWSPPSPPPTKGIDVIFAPDGVLVHDTFFALGTMGVFRFTGVRMLHDPPPAIDFRTVLSSANRFGASASVQALRIPVAGGAAAEAAMILDHFARVASGEIILRPGRFRRAARGALVVAVLGFVTAAGGFAMLKQGVVVIDPALPLITGLLVGLAAAGVAALAWSLDRGQRRRA